jgi:hypothetical protein
MLEAAQYGAADPGSDESAAAREPPVGLGPSELAAALEVVLGQSGGSTALGLMGDRGDANYDEHWQEKRPSAPDGALPPEPLGPLCGSLLAELLVETWLVAGPDAAAPLVLRMVQATLHSADQAMRARVFDLLYTASIAGAALLGGAVPGGDVGIDAAAADAEPPANAFSPPGAPPEPAEQLYARPRSPSGVQRLRGGNNVPGSQLPSPRIHLPPKAMLGQADGGSSRSGADTVGPSPASSPRPAGASSGLSPQHYAGSPRSRLSRRDDQLRSPGRSSSSGSAVDELPGQLVGAFDAWLRKLVFELVSMLVQVYMNGIFWLTQCVSHVMLACVVKCWTFVRLTKSTPVSYLTHTARRGERAGVAGCRRLRAALVNAWRLLDPRRCQRDASECSARRDGCVLKVRLGP